MRRLASLAVLLLVLLPAAAPAQVAPLRVGVVERPPFAMEAEPGVWTGLALELWRLVAESEALTYELQRIDAEVAAAALETGALDLALALDATADLEARTNVVHPFYVATLGVAKPEESMVWRVARGLFTLELLGVIASLSTLLLVVGAIVWLLERRRNADQFHPGVARGLGDGFWWAGVTLTTIGYGDKAPATLAGRAVAMIWMLVGLAVSASLTAAIVAATAVDAEGATLPDDLIDARVGARAGSGAAAYLERLEVAYEPYESAADGLVAVEAGLLDLYLDAAPTLRSLRETLGYSGIAVGETRLDPHYVAIALPEGSVLAERLDRAVLARISGPGWPDIVGRHIPER